ncbi:MAG: tRNA dimethylallyltransferase [Berkelbacteria bacterium GW2011_GWA2_35_9]|uniref:tRNA dimethylallyltransferase n=1 Tax=Berkelbacteria bacterium GW2011_GWA2_35_9 TaxID=1618333 RepID=A0A0G0FNY5_9BACT|nr:MAG: tRNA dimethylallyltransferase [Berkelbacteria bacterium GW2011_GWA2_35_9]
MKKLIAIVGTTASGKSSVAKYIINALPNTEAISIDSRQVFKKLDIGTGKDKTFLQHLLDIKNPGESISVVEFQSIVLKTIEKIIQNHKIPLLVGGSNYYMDAIIYKREFPALKTDKKLHEKLNKMSIVKLYNLLKSCDEDRANNIDIHNKRRLIRALEINILSGKKTLKKEQVMSRDYRYPTLILGIEIDREKLFSSIDKRVEGRIDEGMIKEVRDLIDQGVSKNWLKNLGLEYQIITEYLEAKYSKDEMIQILKFKIHSFARRQLTWLRSNKDIVWVQNKEEALTYVQDFVL